VRLALAMREQMEPLARRWQRRGFDVGFAAGIDMGYATLGTIGFEGRTEYGAVGTVSRAATVLAERASAGQVVLTRRVFVNVEETIHATALGELSVAGFARPVAAFLLEQATMESARPTAIGEPARERSQLTDREWEVVELIARGYTNREIGEALIIAEGTAVRHVANILNKLTLKSRAHVAAWAVEQGRASAGAVTPSQSPGPAYRAQS